MTTYANDKSPDVISSTNKILMSFNKPIRWKTDENTKWNIEEPHSLRIADGSLHHIWHNLKKKWKTKEIIYALLMSYFLKYNS